MRWGGRGLGGGVRGGGGPGGGRRGDGGGGGGGGEGGGGGGETPPHIPKHCRCPLAASPLVTMHDLKQGLAPSRMISARRSASNNYKLKVGVP